MWPSPGVPERHCHHVHNLQWVRLWSSMSLYIETSKSFSTFARSWFSKRSSSLWKATTDSWPMRVLLDCWFATLRHYRPVCVPIWEWFFSWSLFSRLYFCGIEYQSNRCCLLSFVHVARLYWTILFRNGREQWDTGTFTFRDTVV